MALELIVFALFLSLAVAIRRWVSVPPELSHIPQVPILPLLHSYLSGEVEEQRVKRVILPFAQKSRSNVVLLFCFGEWMVHVLDAKDGKRFMEDRAVRKQAVPETMLLWRLTGRQNVFTAEGEMWRRHAKIVHDALHRTTPIEQFASLARSMFEMMGTGGRIRWNDYTHRFTLDAVGTTVIGHDFKALLKPDGPFVQKYHEVMKAISSPPYIFIPSLERWLPRTKVRALVDDLVEDFRLLLAQKRDDPGNDMITYMFEDPEMTETEFRDNVIVTFMGGHDTTAGALSTLVYLLGAYPEVQTRAREEVLRIMGKEEPRMEHYAKMPYLNAVIRESMRYNNPSNVTIPRVASIPLHIGSYVVPPLTPIVLNMCAILHSSNLWSDPEKFEPGRFLKTSKVEEGSWVPFGLGPRQCPARTFSLYEQRVLISMLLREYRWTVPTDSIHHGYIKNAFSPFALSLPYDVYIDFTRLTNSTE
ncbi:cytochrome P450 [Dichomitus squalens LYAD-421 SS1]|uniref:Cytochrome P450 n=2 Tax=Dichomitus squalens TaxID=114155 RepID=A0A4Q9MPG9_9APHY|nr:cytochrome P450 [Dichomitus squalens LYAD-421 SS1]EJF58701.1 cytochrome P450 [Dichomitus squalens LYAD-421 SS1]TBU29644.1 cytochrome P450 [Dichomitus squalens]